MADLWQVHCLNVLHLPFSSLGYFGIRTVGGKERVARTGMYAGFFLKEWVVDRHCCSGVSSGGRTGSALSWALTALSETVGMDA